jgi:hypothetical protein
LFHWTPSARSSDALAADIVNLRQFRKRAERNEKEKQAEQNRLSHGRTKAEKSLTKALNTKAARTLDQGKLERDGATRPTEKPADGGDSDR